MRSGRRRWTRRLLVVMLVLLAAGAVHRGWLYLTGPLLELHNAPERYARRSEAFTANIVGTVSRLGHELAWRLNDGEWNLVTWPAGRTSWPDFVVELPTAALREGDNTLDVRADGWLHSRQTLSHRFVYDPQAPRLPLTVDWRDVAAPDAQDGPWETFLSGFGDARVRPIPGHEHGDQVVAVTGAFAGGRRVTVDMAMRRPVGPLAFLPAALRPRDVELGLLPMWGGYPAAAGNPERRGRRYAAALWSAKEGGVRIGFVERTGGSGIRWISAGRNLPLRWGATYRIVAEAWPVRASDGRHLGYRQRVKLWRAEEPEPTGWLEVDDLADPILPAGDYGVALMASRAAADFGKVTVESIGAPSGNAALTPETMPAFYPGGSVGWIGDKPA